MSEIRNLPVGPDGTVGGRTVPERDRFLDVVRCCAMAAVVLNHYLFSVFHWTPSGGIGRMIQEPYLGYSWVTWPFAWELPAFFFVGGAVIRSSALAMPYRQFVAKRVWRVALPMVACLLTGAVVEVVGYAAHVGNCQPGGGPFLGINVYLTCGAEVWVGPLWFMFVFVPLTLLSPFLARWYRPGRRLLWMGALLALIALSDVRFFNGHRELGTSELCWLVAWLLGFSYADGTLQALGRRTLVAWGTAAGAVWVAGIAFGPWSSILGSFPRTLETAFEALWTIPLLVAFRVPVAGLADWGPVRWIVKVVGPRMMSIYVWHQPAQAIVIMAVSAAHLSMPSRPGTVWLLEKIPWFAACLGVLWLLLKAAEPIERIPAPAWLGGGPSTRRRGAADPRDLEIRP